MLKALGCAGGGAALLGIALLLGAISPQNSGGATARSVKISGAELAAEGAARREIRSEMPKMLRWHHVAAGKEAATDLLLPVDILRELGARRPILVGRSLAYDYRSGVAPTMRAPTGAGRKLAVALRALRLGKGRRLKFKLISGELFPIHFAFPTLVCWRGEIGRSRGFVRASWYEPALDIFDLGMENVVDHTAWSWTRQHFTIFGHQSPPYTVRIRPGRPQISCVGDGSAVFALWRLLTVGAGVMHSGTPAVRRNQLSVTGPLNWTAGQRRLEVFSFRRGLISSIHITQPQIRLYRHFGAPYQLSYSADGITQNTTYFPKFARPYLRGGRTIDIRFGKAGHRRGEYPTSLTVRQGRLVVAVARFDRLAMTHAKMPSSPWNQRPPRGLAQVKHQIKWMDLSEQANVHPRWTPTYYSGNQLRPNVRGHVLRYRIYYNCYAATCLGNWPELSRTLRAYRGLLRVEHIPIAFYVYSLEYLTMAANHFCSAARVRLLCQDFTLPALELLTPREIARHAAELVGQYRYGLAILALDALRTVLPGGARLHRWADARRVWLEELVSRIAHNPRRYRLYARVNQYYSWRATTVLNEQLARAF